MVFDKQINDSPVARARVANRVEHGARRIHMKYEYQASGVRFEMDEYHNQRFHTYRRMFLIRAKYQERSMELPIALGLCGTPTG
jgi:hypothetical protein